MKLNKKITISGLIMAAVFSAGALTGIGTTSLISSLDDSQNSPDGFIYSGIGTIVYVDRINATWGFFYAIAPELNQNDLPFQFRYLIPIYLPLEFQEDGLQVRFTVKMGMNLNIYNTQGLSRSDAIVEILEIETLN